MDLIIWEGFKVMYYDYEKCFPSSSRDKMLSKLLAHKQGTRSINEYDSEFNRLIKFAPEGIRDHEQTKMQKFRDGLNPDI